MGQAVHCQAHSVLEERGSEMVCERETRSVCGRWISAQGGVHIIGLDYVQWQSGESSAIYQQRNGQEHIVEINGQVMTSMLTTESRLQWSDGDVWTRDLRGPQTGTYAAISDTLGTFSGAALETAASIVAPVASMVSTRMGLAVQDPNLPEGKLSDAHLAGAGARVEETSCEGQARGRDPPPLDKIVEPHELSFLTGVLWALSDLSKNPLDTNRVAGLQAFIGQLTTWSPENPYASLVAPSVAQHAEVPKAPTEDPRSAPLLPEPPPPSTVLPLTAPARAAEARDDSPQASPKAWATPRPKRRASRPSCVARPPSPSPAAAAVVAGTVTTRIE
mmetsp:Transcript_81376/g.214687  ORF Transcript_81376/g.214687 Transcript_81376/m.214687 type:complete len:333 (+) Transcript_81376:62-1060(+)